MFYCKIKLWSQISNKLNFNYPCLGNLAQARDYYKQLKNKCY